MVFRTDISRKSTLGAPLPCLPCLEILRSFTLSVIPLFLSFKIARKTLMVEYSVVRYVDIVQCISSLIFSNYVIK